MNKWLIAGAASLALAACETRPVAGPDPSTPTAAVTGTDAAIYIVNFDEYAAHVIERLRRQLARIEMQHVTMRAVERHAVDVLRGGGDQHVLRQIGAAGRLMMVTAAAEAGRISRLP